MNQPATCLRVCGPDESNAFGTAHGGIILQLANQCGQAAVQARYPNARVLTEALLRLDFIHPAFTGETMTATATLDADGVLREEAVEVSVIIHAGKSPQDVEKTVAMARMRFRLEDNV